ncbi:formate dehydrogenase accessory sulfurtransferase FdhD [Gudongella sp. DL1XJH-153]|uniref:formate dehydrogenase accessory sulfurtransferase FdhD n=1 Tax=Gudongella sp. DL1XJH-153 TaxID=3409804 RepID=UPI003BB5C0A4
MRYNLKNKVDVEIIKIKGSRRDTLMDQVIREYPFTIYLNDQEIITLLCTPEDLEELATGFLISEGFLDDFSEVENWSLDSEKGIINMHGNIKEKPLREKLRGKRTITSGCGKGTSFFNVLDSSKSKRIKKIMEISPQNVVQLMIEFNSRSSLFDDTGGVHSCALCNREEILVHRDDIGRHNALDKILGWGHINGQEFGQTMVLTTGRISSEMMIKIARRGIPVVISRSAPTSLAVDLARELGITLVGFARGDKMNIYTNFPSIDF